MRDSDKADGFLGRANQIFHDFEQNKFAFQVEKSPDLLRRVWEQSLSDFRKFLRCAEQAARNMDRKTWADALIEEVKGSPVLNYVFHARNADEHTYFPVSTSQSRSISIGDTLFISGDNRGLLMTGNKFIFSDIEGRAQEFYFDAVISKMVNGRIENGWIETEAPILRKPAFLRLEDVVDRGVVYPVPRLNCSKEELPRLIFQKVFDWMFTKIKALNGFEKN